MSNENAALMQALATAQSAQEQVALVTVTRVIGSAYRREGAKMLVTSSGQSACMISGGCLEQEMIEIAMRTLAKGHPERTVFDYAEDKSWWPGCGGTVEVWIEPLQQSSLSVPWLEQSLATPSVLATVIGGGSGQLWVGPSGVLQGQLSSAELQQAVERTALSMLKGHSRPTTRYVAEAEVFFDLYNPQPQLVLLGAGHDAKPLANLALVMGFAVTVVDGRSEMLAGFHDVQTVLAHPHELAQKLTIGPQANVVVMNHHLDHDRMGLRFALESPAPYVGVLGPRNRLERMLGVLQTEGFGLTPDQSRRLRNPIGIDMGAESPEEIAVAVLAEVIALARGYKAGFLNDKKSGIHDPSAQLASAKET